MPRLGIYMCFCFPKGLQRGCPAVQTRLLEKTLGLPMGELCWPERIPLSRLCSLAGPGTASSPPAVLRVVATGCGGPLPQSTNCPTCLDGAQQVISHERIWTLLRLGSFSPWGKCNLSPSPVPFWKWKEVLLITTPAWPCQLRLSRICWGIWSP